MIRGEALTRNEHSQWIPAPLTAIPYYAWNHRGAGALSVWLLEDPTAAGPRQTSEWVGTNYTPAYCVNQVQMWHDFRPDVIESELAAARQLFGINTLRVYLHNNPYDAERDQFLANIEQFLAICQSYLASGTRSAWQCRARASASGSTACIRRPIKTPDCASTSKILAIPFPREQSVCAPGTQPLPLTMSSCCQSMRCQNRGSRIMEAIQLKTTRRSPSHHAASHFAPSPPFAPSRETLRRSRLTFDHSY